MIKRGPCEPGADSLPLKFFGHFRVRKNDGLTIELIVNKSGLIVESNFKSLLCLVINHFIISWLIFQNVPFV